MDINEGGYVVPEEVATQIREALKQWIKCGACGAIVQDKNETLCEACRSTQGGGYYGDEANTY
jgi:hypothetical protein